MENLVKKSYKFVQDKYDRLEEELNRLRVHLWLKDMLSDSSRLEVKEVEYTKYKKYGSDKFQIIFLVWEEHFVDEDTGEVVGIERKEAIAIYLDGNVYQDFYIYWDKIQKKHLVSYEPNEFNPTNIILNYLPKKELNKLNN